jgi:hypothetical protein
MPQFELYSQRQKKLQQSDQPVIYNYSPIPREFRVQVIYIWKRYFPSRSRFTSQAWANIATTLAEEYGQLALGTTETHYEDCEQFILDASTTGVLDIIELSFYEISRSGQYGIVQTEPQRPIDELNARFRQHDLGYQLEGGQIVRVDNQYLHSAVVEPSIHLLYNVGFQGALDEFLKAHKHYRNGEHKQAIMEAAKAFESTLKSICDKCGWTYAPTATANPLIKTVIDQGLIERAYESSFSALANLMTGLPTLRNKKAGHGQGQNTIEVPDYLVAYALHQCAANIVMLISAYEEFTEI